MRGRESTRATPLFYAVEGVFSKLTYHKQVFFLLLFRLSTGDHFHAVRGPKLQPKMRPLRIFNSLFYGGVFWPAQAHVDAHDSAVDINSKVLISRL